MFVRDVDLPSALIEAHRAGRLVLFVGAGTSRDPPSDLPDFRTLTDKIVAEAQMVVGDDLEPDVVLGRLADLRVDVHVRVAARIGVLSSKPNRLHQAIVDLAAAGQRVRIVTTNYDRHLSTVLDERGIDVLEFMGPALPMGDDFEGLVYIHGSLQQVPRRLVVTDGDFGRAYLRDAWAARFLERMFATYPVLFIGYSHDDVVMRYLARGLAPGPPRYVLDSSPDKPKWRQLGIQAVGYPIVDGSRAALVEAIEGWASLASMGLLDHRQRAAQLLAGPPSQVPEEASYLEALVADPQRVAIFAEFARGEEWLSWATTQPEFRRLFDPTAARTECTPTLADWFAQQFVMVENLSAAALGVVREARGKLGPAVCSAIGHHLHMRKGARPEWLGPWLVLLAENDTEQGHHWLEYALIASRWPEDKAAALLLFDHLTAPHAAFRQMFGFDSTPRFDVRLRGDEHSLRDSWQELFVPNLTEAAPAVLAIVDRQLRRAHQLLVTAASAGPGWDPVSASRSAIDSHPQDRIRGDVDVLIDAARDCLESLLDGGDALGIAYMNAWSDTEVPIFRRLAAHGWAHRSDVDSTAKITWLHDQGWLFDHQMRHEVFRLIEVSVPEADIEVADALVADATAGPAVADEDLHAYERFNLLSWINRHAPQLQSALNALEAVQAEHPNFQVREHPDLLAWSDGGTVPSTLPMTTAELHQLISADPAAAIVELRHYESTTFSLHGPTWQDALAVLIETVRDQPPDGFAILDAEGGNHPDIVRAAIRGWSAGDVHSDTANEILNRLRQVDVPTAADDLARLLSDGGRSDTNPTEWHRFPAARQLAEEVWNTLNGEAPETSVTDWLSKALNDPAGRLALFWVHAVAADWRDSGQHWDGPSVELRSQLGALLAGDDHRNAMAEVIFASQVLFFFGADREWCESHVLPLLDWSNPHRAQRTWDGFAIWGRWNDQLLTAGLIEHYLDSARHIGDLREEVRRQLCAHLAGVAVSSEVDPDSWMQTFTATVEVKYRVEWMNQITWLLDDMPAPAVEHQWQRWMMRYWKQRLESVPTVFTAEEASAMAPWVVYLTESIDEGVALAVEHPAALAEHTNLVHDLAGERLDRAPAAIGKLLAHLLRNTTPPFWEGCYLATIVPRLRDRADPDDVHTIVQESLRLGWADAPNW